MILPEAETNALKSTKIIGIIGLGDMGALYATRFSNAGWKVIGCDREDMFETTKKKYENSNFEVVANGHLVSRVSDYIIYSVDAESIGKIIAAYGASTKYGAIIGGQTSCKEPEVLAFEKYMPSDTSIISVHSLHGPTVDPTGQPLVLINHRSDKDNQQFNFVDTLVSCLKSKHVYLTAKEHDQITSDTQAVTHAAFLSMGTAWKSSNQYPWENPRWTGGLENAKMNISMRIFSNKWHVYAGLSITNPSAHTQILQYAQSTSELFTLMIQRKKQELQTRLFAAREFLFKHIDSDDLLLNDDILEKYSLSKIPPGGRQPNSHLSLLAIADTWYSLQISPYDHIICSTPLFRIFLGVTEYLFCQPGLLEEAIELAVSDATFRHDDLEFVIAARSWSDLVNFGNYELYKRKFEDTQTFFASKFKEANAVGNEMIRIILERVRQTENK